MQKYDKFIINSRVNFLNSNYAKKVKNKDTLNQYPFILLAAISLFLLLSGWAIVGRLVFNLNSLHNSYQRILIKYNQLQKHDDLVQELLQDNNRLRQENNYLKNNIK